MQRYFVEIYDKSFEKITNLGPFSYDEAQQTLKRLTGQGYYFTITEEEFI